MALCGAEGGNVAFALDALATSAPAGSEPP